MNLAIVTPSYFPSVRGNSITVQRIESGLRDQGVSVQVFSLDRQDRDTILTALQHVRPDVIHGFHATATGVLAMAAARERDIPVVITLTGTDLNHDLFEASLRSTVLTVLEGVKAIVVFHEAIRDKLLQEAPALRRKVHVIGQTVQCNEKPYDLRGALGFDLRDFIIFQPAGIRRVKNIPSVIPLVRMLHERHPRLRYVLAGPIIEADEGSRVLAMLQNLPWAYYPGALNHEEICAVLPTVQVVLNSSLSEGGMSNAVLEAMSKGVPVLASDIEGNRTVIVDGHDGFLYRSDVDFIEKMERLILDSALRSSVGRRARQKIETEFPLEGEVTSHLRLYQALAAARGA